MMNRTEHLLTILAEECNEVGQRVSKALRFGLNEVQPGQTRQNTDRLLEEILDLFAVVEMLQEEGLIYIEPSIGTAAIDAKKAKVEKFLEYSKQCGTLT